VEKYHGLQRGGKTVSHQKRLSHRGANRWNQKKYLVSLGLGGDGRWVGQGRGIKKKCPSRITIPECDQERGIVGRDITSKKKSWERWFLNHN